MAIETVTVTKEEAKMIEEAKAIKKAMAEQQAVKAQKAKQKAKRKANYNIVMAILLALGTVGIVLTSNQSLLAKIGG